MVFPLFMDFAHCAKQLLFTGFPLNSVNLNASVGTCNGGNVSLVSSLQMPEMNIAFGELTYNWNVGNWNTVVSPGVDQDGRILLKVAQDFCKLVPGLSLTSSGVLNTVEKDIGGNGVLTYQHPMFSFQAGASSFEKTEVTGSVATGYNNFLIGASASTPFDGQEGMKLVTGIGYCGCDAQLHLLWNTVDEFKGFVWQKFNDNFESGIWLNYRQNPGNAEPAAAEEGGDAGATEGALLKPYSESGNVITWVGKFIMSPCTAVKVKLNSDSEVGVGLETKIREGTVLTLGAQVDGKAINGGKHQIGLGLEFNV